MGHVTPGLHRSVNDQHESLNEWIEIELMCYKKKDPYHQAQQVNFVIQRFKQRNYCSWKI